MRGFLAGFLFSVTAASAAVAQTSIETQAPVPIGGADTRSLPSRSTLPPMFGANLFQRGLGTTVQFAGSAPTTSRLAAGSTQAANGGLGAIINAALGGGQAGAGALGSMLPQAAGAAAAGAMAINPIVSATNVPPPRGWYRSIRTMSWPRATPSKFISTEQRRSISRPR